MKRVQAISAVLLAIPLLGSGVNALFRLHDVTAGYDSAGADFLRSMRDGGLMGWVSLGHVVTGALLLPRRWRFLAGLAQFPITLGILAFNATMFPPGVPLAVAMFVLNVGVLASPAEFRRLLRIGASSEG